VLRKSTCEYGKNSKCYILLGCDFLVAFLGALGGGVMASGDVVTGGSVSSSLGLGVDDEGSLGRLFTMPFLVMVFVYSK
jgi:hypothetical protein